MQMDPKMWEQGRREGDSMVPSGRGVLKGEWQIVQSEGKCGHGCDRGFKRVTLELCGSEESGNGFSGGG